MRSLALLPPFLPLFRLENDGEPVCPVLHASACACRLGRQQLLVYLRTIRWPIETSSATTLAPSLRERYDEDQGEMYPVALKNHLEVFHAEAPTQQVHASLLSFSSLVFLG
jgi:hypothetical protein